MVISLQIKKIVALCKKRKLVTLYETKDEVQWLGDGIAIYPLYDMPCFTADLFCSLYDITDKQSEKIAFQISDMPSTVDVSDAVENETQCEVIDISIYFGGKRLIPIKTSEGIVYIDKEHLAPIGDLEMDMVFFFERNTDGHRYIVVKCGFNVVAILVPQPVITEKFCETLKEIAELTEARRHNMKEANAING